MNITPVIPDGYNGPIKQLTRRICKHIFYLTMSVYGRLQEVYYCHECSLILSEELQKNQVAQSSIPPRQAPRPASLPFEQVSDPVLRPPEPAFVSPRPAFHIPQPRSIDRDKMTVEQLLEEAEMLRKLSRPREALAVYDEILHLDPVSAKACGEKGWALISLKRYTEVQAAFDHALQLDPSASRAQSGIHYLSSYIFHNQEVEENAGTIKKHTAAKETLAKPCQSAQDYYELGNALITLDRDVEAFDAFARSIELDPFNLDTYERVSTLHFVREHYEKSLAKYDQALQIFVECAALYEKRAETLVLLRRYQEALDACDRAIRLDGSSASAYSEKATFLARIQRDEDALAVYDQYIE